MKKILLAVAALILALLVAFQKQKSRTHPTAAPAETHSGTSSIQESKGAEDFETGHKTSYTAGDVSLPSGNWHFEHALLGSSDRDHKNGHQAIRLQKDGSITTLFQQSGVTNITVAHALYGEDAPSAWELLCSADDGNTWQSIGKIQTVNTNPTAASFAVKEKGNLRFQIHVLAGGRLNIDDFSTNGKTIPSTTANSSNEATKASNGVAAQGIAGRDDNMALGNPSKATTNEANANNYLMVKKQYALSYNNSKGMANWVSWHLSTAWRGDAQRCNCFTADESLPASFFKVATSNYIRTGFDRGHLCPSDDRTASAEDNAATFLMTNMSPQAPILNQQTWESLESYCRSLLNEGKEMYIIAGGYGTGGSGSNGGNNNSIANGKINVPAHFWKIVVVLPVGENDLSRINTDAKIIAVDMPNQQDVNQYSWQHYQTTVDQLEAATGYDFLSNVPVKVQAALEAH